LITISLLSLWLAKEQKRNPWPIILEHIAIALIVVVATHFLGQFIGGLFGG